MPTQTKRYGIIVGVDGSPASDSAVSWAAHDAAIRGVPLTLVRVENSAAPTWSQIPILEQVRGWQQAEGRGILANGFKIAHDTIGEKAGVHINGELLFSATVPTLIELSKHAALIVVGTDGRGALNGGLLGSVSSGLVRHARCPVAVIHEENRHHHCPTRPLWWWGSTVRRVRSSPQRSHSMRPHVAASVGRRPCRKRPGASRTSRHRLVESQSRRGASTDRGPRGL